jgi:TetR/AcrR family acrAB operon transcriptional repressor
MVRKCKEDAEKTRRAILESALDVFSEKGYAKATFDEIAVRAGFTKGAIYWYFRNKADLVAALIVEYVQRKQQEVDNFSSDDLTLDSLLEEFCMWAQMSQNDLRYAKFNRFILCQMEWSETVLERVDKSLIDLKNFHLEKINKVLVKSRENGKLKDTVDIDKMQHIIISSYMGIMFSSLSKRFDDNVVDMVRIGLGALFDGIKK